MDITDDVLPLAHEKAVWKRDEKGRMLPVFSGEKQVPKPLIIPGWDYKGAGFTDDEIKNGVNKNGVCKLKINGGKTSGKED